MVTIRSFQWIPSLTTNWLLIRSYKIKQAVVHHENISKRLFDFWRWRILPTHVHHHVHPRAMATESFIWMVAGIALPAAYALLSEGAWATCLSHWTVVSWRSQAVEPVPSRLILWLGRMRVHKWLGREWSPVILERNVLNGPLRMMRVHVSFVLMLLQK